MFSPLERQVLEYAEAASRTPPTVTDEMVAPLLEGLGPAGLLERTNVIGFANLTTRSNTALGIESGCRTTRSAPPCRSPRLLSQFAVLVPGSTIEPVWLNGAPAALIRSAGELTAVSLVIEEGLISGIYAVRNPHKLTALSAEARLSRRG